MPSSGAQCVSCRLSVMPAWEGIRKRSRRSYVSVDAGNVTGSCGVPGRCQRRARARIAVPRRCHSRRGSRSYYRIDTLHRRADPTYWHKGRLRWSDCHSRRHTATSPRGRIPETFAAIGLVAVVLKLVTRPLFSFLEPQLPLPAHPIVDGELVIANPVVVLDIKPVVIGVVGQA